VTPRKKAATAKPESDLVLRIRQILARKRGITEKRMFGGLCFFAGGNMIGGPTGEDELVVRVGPDKYEECLAEEHARPMDFTSRPMRGFVYVDARGITDNNALRRWLEKGLAYARSLPLK
jgi:TfoX/Sxy family transcriptional regulator of competence genes